MHRQDRSADKMRTIHDQRVTVVLKLFMPPAPRDTSVPGLNGNRMNFPPGDSRDVLRRNTDIDNALMVVVKIDVVDDRGLIENPCYLTGLDAMTSWMRIAEVLCCHKREGIRPQVQTGTRRVALVDKSDTGPINSRRRQGRPAT